MASRVENSLRNVFAAWGGQAVSSISSFVVRAVFVATLAQEFVGLESLFSSLLTILTLADLGVGAAIVFSLYAPLAQGDKETVKSLMRLFRRAYFIIGIVVIAVGALLAPNVKFFVGSDAPPIPHLELYFFCFVLNTGVSYFFSYKGSLITADQKSYVVYLIQYAFQALMGVFQIAVLLITHDYLAFLACMIGSTLLQNICIAVKADRMYPYLKEKDVRPLDKGILSDIKKNIAGLIMHKVASVASTPVSNLVITNFVGLATTSLYGNYLLVVNALTRIVDKVFDSIVASVGNLGAKESEDRQYEVFQTAFFVNAVLYSTISGGLFCSFNAFISLWVGESWCFPNYLVMLIVLVFFVKGMRCAAYAFTSAYGLFWLTKWKAVLEAVSLPLLAVALAGPFGMAGVLAASVISSVLISTPYEAWAVYSHGFHRPLRNYFKRYAVYAAAGLGSIAVAFFLCELVQVPYLAAFFIKGLIGAAAPLLTYALFFGRTREFREFKGIVVRIVGKLKGKLCARGR